MKAVVVEINKHHVAVLSDNGCITKIKNENYEIGQTIQINNAKVTISKRLATMAASAAALLVLGTGTWAYASPYTYVSVDVNPSIEFTVNRFDRVIKVKAVNDDGAVLIEDTTIKKLTNDTIRDAIIVTVDQISKAGYFTDEAEGGIVIATSSKNSGKANKLAEELETTVEEETANNGNEVIIETFTVDKDQVQEAQDLGVTPGKLNLVEKLIESSDDPSSINKNDWLKKSVKEIMKATKENNKANTSEIDTKETIGEAVNPTPESTSDQSTVNSDDNNKDSLAKKAEKEAEKALEKAQKAEEKANKAEEKADKAAKDAAKVNDAKKKEAESKAKKAELEAKQAKEAAKEAAKAAEKAKKDAEKAKKDAEKAKKDTEKSEIDNKTSEKNNDKNNDKKKDDVLNSNLDINSNQEDNNFNDQGVEVEDSSISDNNKGNSKDTTATDNEIVQDLETEDSNIDITVEGNDKDSQNNSGNGNDSSYEEDIADDN